jgi:hypothetical protein
MAGRRSPVIELSAGATSVVAHGIHYAVVGVGVVGLLALIGPQLVGGLRAPPIRDEHALRVLALTEQISSGQLGFRMTPTLPVSWARSEAIDHVRTRYLPIAVVSSAAAAGVHAAVGPAHFREGLVIGMFFAGAALAQVGWSLAMAIRPSHTLLVAAVAGNSAVLLLWLGTRTIGLPGLLPGPEAVGAWDVSCGIWELAVIFSAVRILRADSDSGTGLRLPSWPDWGPSARVWAIGSAFVLPALSVIGAGA